jgi:hypothetical protein
MNDNDNNSLMIMYKDYTFLMHVACQTTSNLYFYIKVILNVLNLIMSSAMSAMELSYMNIAMIDKDYNSFIFNNLLIMVKSGSVVNLVICLVSGTLYYFQIAERELFFKIQAENYLKLNNIIILELSVRKKIDETFVRFVIQEFTFLIENMTFKFPSFIKKNIKKNYKTYNIPPYLDVYIHNFGFMSNFINFLNVNKGGWYIRNSSNIDLEKNCVSPKFSNINYINNAYNINRVESNNKICVDDSNNMNMLVRENSSYFSSNNNIYIYSIPIDNQIIQM